MVRASDDDVGALASKNVNLSLELRTEYLHRAAVIANTSKQLFNMGDTTIYMDLDDVRRLVEENAAAEGVGV